MDPNAALARMLEIAGMDDADDLSAEDAADLLVELATLTLGLDQWLSNKGFLPEKWER